MRYCVNKRQNNSNMCFVCGMLNSAGMKARFYECTKEIDGADVEKNILLTVVQPQEIYQSYPNRMHGGIISALLDEVIGRAVQIAEPDMWGVTIDLNVKFRKPAPLDQTLYIEGKTTKVDQRTFDGEGKLFLKDGTVCATATGRYFIVSLEKAFPNSELNEKNWFQVEEEIPEFFEFRDV